MASRSLASSSVGLACAMALVACSAASSNSDAGHGTGGAAGRSTGSGGGPGTGGSAGGPSQAGGTGGSGPQNTGGSAGGAGGATGGARASGGRGSGGAAGSAATGGAMAGSSGKAGAAGGAGGAAGTVGSSGLLAPAQGALLGAYVGTGTLASFETELGRKLAINHNFVGWSADFTTMLPGLAAGGRIPLITWEAWDNSVGASLTAIAGGTYDSMITARAQAVKSFGQKFFLRWGHEMNGNWYPWDGSHNGASAAAATTFIAAYRHIHDLFVAAGATNALWVFCPNVDSVPNESWNQWQNYYPGDAYVDWTGFDGYNWGTVQSTSTWQSFPTIAGRIYPGLAAKGKPIMIPETASTELGGDKAAWVAAIVPSLQTMFPNVKALVWFEMNKETDWRAESSSAAQTAFVTMAKDPYLNP